MTILNIYFDFLNPVTYGGAVCFDLIVLGLIVMAYGIRKENRE